MVAAAFSATIYDAEMGRLTELRERAGLSGPELARRVGAQAPEIWRLERWPARGGRRITLQWAERLAPVLGVNPQDLLFDSTVSQPLLDVSVVNIRGEVAANRWLEQYEFVDEALPQIPVVPGRFAGLEQFAFKISGPCMDVRRIFSGDFVICVNYFEARQALTDGDVVIVERKRGQAIERTCRELIIVNGGFELWPRSTNPNFQTPFRVAGGTDLREADGTQVEIIALVIGRYAPF